MNQYRTHKETQYNKILKLHENNDWVCQVSYWNSFIRNPHKRRSELEATGRYRFEWRKCEHGYRNVRDYKMHEIGALPESDKERDEALLRAAVQ